MLKRSTQLLAMLVVLLALFVDVFAGGGKRNGTAGANELLIPVGARGLALSGAYVSGISGLDAIFYNPAGLSASKSNVDAMFSYMNYIADIGYTFAAVGINSETLGSFAFSLRSMDFGDIPITTTENPYGTGSTFSPTYVILGVSYSNFLTDRIKVGININLISETIERINATGFGIDAGLQYSNLANIDGLSFGMVLRNLGPKMEFTGEDLLVKAKDDEGLKLSQFRAITTQSFELPSQLEMGLAYERDFSELYNMILAMSFQNNTFANDEYKFAAEFSYNDLVAVRGGYTLVTESIDEEEESIFGPTFGVGFKVPGDIALIVDYAYRHTRYFDANHMVSLKIGF